MPGQVVPPGYSSFGQAGRLLYGSSLDDKDEEAFIRRCIPEAFACGCLLLFAGPVVKSFHLAYDPLVIRWVGDWPQVAALAPLFCVAWGYAMHRITRRPSKFAVLLSLLGSSVILAVMANRVGMASLELGDRMAASDCTTFPAKYALQREWKEASRLYTSCRSSSSVSASYVVQDCPEYAAQQQSHTSWAFLKLLEEVYGCAGWCTHAEPLWTLGKKEDSCSSVTAFVMTAKIHPTANQVFVYSIVVLLFTSVVLFLAGPWLRDQGVEW
mmetsp:Transcript_107030/g.284795  ORF Transcript_107030/g.284795 Transcript_107030/m.284795 type:complete len:269 (-) Transcript_107030:38-844(-)